MPPLAVNEMQSGGGSGTHENSLARRGEAPKKVEYASSHCCCGCGSHGMVCLDGAEDAVG
jgi:hypothetical protein